MKKYLPLLLIIMLVTEAAKAQPNAVITANGPTAFCQGGSVMLTANSGAGYSYQWKNSGSPISGATLISYTATLGGGYTCVVTDGTGSSTSNVIAVTVNPVPGASIIGNSNICIGSSASITISFSGVGPFTYTYTDGMNTSGPLITAVTPIVINVTPMVSTTYTLVSVSNPTCAGNVSGSAIVIVHPLPSAMLSGNPSICAGGTANLSLFFTGNPPFTYFYSDGSANFGPFTTNFNVATIQVSPLVTTTYFVYGIQDMNCTGTGGGSATVTVNGPSVTITANGPTSFCHGDSVILSANSGFVSYQWTKHNFVIAGATSQNFVAKHQGNFRCVATDLTGCAGTSQAIFVAVPCGPIIINNPNRNEITNSTGIKNSYVITDDLQLNVPVKSFKLFNSQGMLLNEIAGSNSTKEFQISFESLKSGIYFLELFLNDSENSVAKTRVLKL